MVHPPFRNPPCPVCCNKDTHVELVLPDARNNNLDEYACRCGKCGLRYSATLERHVWMVVPGASTRCKPVS
jgi:hypothetical protein